MGDLRSSFLVGMAITRISTFGTGLARVLCEFNKGNLEIEEVRSEPVAILHCENER